MPSVLKLVAVLFVGSLLACAPRVDEAACAEQAFEGARFIVCAFDAETDELRLAVNDDDGRALRTFLRLEDHLGDDAQKLRFAMNAGMYNDAGAPIGLYIENGETLHDASTTNGPGNFHLKPNGVFSLDDAGVHVETTEAYLQRAPASIYATQSGPMLVIDGALHDKFQEDGPSRLIRNGVGVSDSQHAFFVITRTPVSFGRMARFFRDALDCDNALFLDGTVSSLWAPNLSRKDRGFDLGPMIVVTRAAP